MQYFKTIEGMLSHQFEQDGEKNDQGEPIKATEQPIKHELYVAQQGSVLYEKMMRMIQNPQELRPPPFNCPVHTNEHNDCQYPNCLCEWSLTKF